jgi:hypothetical protein
MTQAINPQFKVDAKNHCPKVCMQASCVLRTAGQELERPDSHSGLTPLPHDAPRLRAQMSSVTGCGGRRRLWGCEFRPAMAGEQGESYRR